MFERLTHTASFGTSFTAIGIALAFAAPAQAQQGSGMASAAEEVDTAGIGDIIVTAQRRSESVQKVPIAITAVPPERLEQLTLRTVDQVAAVTPSLTFQSGFGFSQTFIRGVGTTLPTPGLEGSIATYIDGSYLTRGIGAIFDLLDVESVQVLKGPQGTLYGRNATGGAIIVNSAKPTDELGGYALAEYGRFDHVLGEAVLNLPVSDRLAMRFAGRYVSEDGYINNATQGKKVPDYEGYILRGSAKYSPGSDFSAVLTTEYSRSKSDPFPHIQRFSDSLRCLACAFFGEQPTVGFYQAENDVAGPDTFIRSFSANLRMNWSSGVFNVESVTGYRNLLDVAGNDLDGTGVNLVAFNHRIGGKTYNQDFTVSTDSGSWIDGMFGLSYVYDNGFYETDFRGIAFAGLPVDPVTGNALPNVFNRVKTESISAFAEVSMHPVPAMTITIGGRYSYDSRKLFVDQNLASYLAFAGGVGPQSFTDSTDYRKFTPRLVVAYEAGDVNLYASYNMGFKAGGFSTTQFIVQPDINPETIDSYEVGAKYVSPDRRLRLNLAGFYYKQQDLQVRVTDLQSGGGRVLNAAASRGYGVEADFEYQLGSALSIYGGGAWLDTKFTDYRNASVNSVFNDPDPANPGQTIPVFRAGFEDLTGFRLPSAPKLTGFLGFNLEQPIGADWILGLNGVARYTDDYDFYPGAGGSERYDRQKEYVLVNVSGFVAPASKKYQIGFYVNNVLDKKYVLQRLTSAPFGATEDPAKPRTYGVRLRYDF